MDESLEVPVRYEAEDLRDAWKLMPMGAVWGVVGSLFGGFAVIWMGVVVWWFVEWIGALTNSAGDFGIWVQAVMSLGIGSLGVTGLGALFGVMLWRSWKVESGKMLARLKSDDTRSMRIGETGVSIQGRFSETQYAWSYIRGIKEYGGTMAIGLKQDHVLLLPKRDLSGEAQIRIRELVARYQGRAGPPGTLGHDAGALFWEGEMSYTRGDIAVSSRLPQQKEARSTGDPARDMVVEKKRKQKLSRAFMGWVLILSAAILLFVVMHDPRAVPAAGAPATTEGHHPWFVMACSTAAAVAWILAWAKLVPELGWRRIRGHATMPRRIAIGTLGIVTAQAEIREWHPWGAIVDVEQYADGLVLVSAEEWRLVVPLRGVDEERRRSLAEFARGKMGGRALGFEVIHTI